MTFRFVRSELQPRKTLLTGTVDQSEPVDPSEPVVLVLSADFSLTQTSLRAQKSLCDLTYSKADQQWIQPKTFPVWRFWRGFPASRWLGRRTPGLFQPHRWSQECRSSLPPLGRHRHDS